MKVRVANSVAVRSAGLPTGDADQEIGATSEFADGTLEAHDHNAPVTEPASPGPEPPPDARPTGSPLRRLASLDAFRGLTILGMLLVNNMALDEATPRALTHAAWNQGVTFADMVFPWFLLIMGVAIPFAAASHRREGLSGWLYVRKVFTRAVILVLVGGFLDSSLARQPVFGLGVLQLIGLAYLTTALLAPLGLAWRLLIAAVLLSAHWAAIRFLPVPGIGAGVFTESQNLIRYLNQVYLQPYHLKGLVSVVPTTALALIGTAIGDVLRREPDRPTRKAASLLLGGAALAAAGWLWNQDLPFNKPLWTASYILYTAGWGACLLGLFYLVMDAGGRSHPSDQWRGGNPGWALPLVVFGANAILAYVAPILVKVHLLQEWQWTLADGSHLPVQQALLHFCTVHAGRVPGGWTYTLAYIFACWLALFFLYRRKIYLRI